MKITFWSIVIGDDHGCAHTKLFYEEQLALDYMEEMENGGDYERILSEKPMKHDMEIDENVEVTSLDGEEVPSCEDDLWI